MLQEVTVGVTTKPVTQVEVVAVNSASKNGVGFPLAELTGSESNTAPIPIAIKKLNNRICVVDILGRCFFINPSFYCKKAKGTNALCRQLVPFTSIVLIIITYSAVIVKFLRNLIQYPRIYEVYRKISIQLKSNGSQFYGNNYLLLSVFYDIINEKVPETRYERGGISYAVC